MSDWYHARARADPPPVGRRRLRGPRRQRTLCAAVPAGLEAFFAEFGDRVDSRTAPPPDLSDKEKQARLRRAIERAPDYGMGLLPPSD